MEWPGTQTCPKIWTIANNSETMGRIKILRALFTLQLLILSTGTHFQPRIPTYLGSRGLKSLRDLNLCVFIRMGDLFFRQSAAFWAKITSNGQHRLPLLTIFSRVFSWVTHTDVFIRCWAFIFKQSYMRDWTSLAEIVPNVRSMRFFPQNGTLWRL